MILYCSDIITLQHVWAHWELSLYVCNVQGTA